VGDGRGRLRYRLGSDIAQALVESGGPMTAEEQAWADAALGVPTSRRRTVA
jgi:hypothetical protein